MLAKHSASDAVGRSALVAEAFLKDQSSNNVLEADTSAGLSPVKGHVSGGHAGWSRVKKQVRTAQHGASQCTERWATHASRRDWLFERAAQTNSSGFDQLHKSLERLTTKMPGDLPLNEKWKRIGQYLDAYAGKQASEYCATSLADVIDKASQTSDHNPDELLACCCVLLDQLIHLTGGFEPALQKPARMMREVLMAAIFTHHEDPMVVVDPDVTQAEARELYVQRIHTTASNTYQTETWRGKAMVLDAFYQVNRATGGEKVKQIEVLQQHADHWKNKYLQVLFTGWRMVTFNATRLEAEMQRLRDQSGFQENEFESMTQMLSETKTLLFEAQQHNKELRHKFEQLEIKEKQQQKELERFRASHDRMKRRVKQLEEHLEDAYEEVRKFEATGHDTGASRAGHCTTAADMYPRADSDHLQLCAINDCFETAVNLEYDAKDLLNGVEVLDSLISFLHLNVSGVEVPGMSVDVDIGSDVRPPDSLPDNAKLDLVRRGFQQMRLPDSAVSLLHAAVANEQPENVPLQLLQSYLFFHLHCSVRDTHSEDESPAPIPKGLKEWRVRVPRVAQCLGQAIGVVLEATGKFRAGSVPQGTQTTLQIRDDDVATEYLQQLTPDFISKMLPHEEEAAQRQAWADVTLFVTQHIDTLASIFQFYAAGEKRQCALTDQQLWRMLVDALLVEEGEVQQIVTAAYLSSAQGTRRRSSHRNSAKDAKEGLPPSGWITALVTLSQELKTGDNKSDLATQFGEFVGQVMRFAQRLSLEDFRGQVNTSSVRRVVQIYHDRLVAVFREYGTTEDDQGKIAMAEMLRMLRDASIIGPPLSSEDAQLLFYQASWDDDADTLIFPEFLEVLMAIVLFHHPSPYIPFERRLDSFLATQLLDPLQTLMEAPSELVPLEDVEEEDAEDGPVAP